MEIWTTINQDPNNTSPVKNSGTISLVCYINRTCPFIKSQKENKVVIFNHRTLGAIYEGYSSADSASMRNLLTAVPDERAEGIFFNPQCYGRHNYIYKPKQTSGTSGTSGTDNILSLDYSKFEEISEGVDTTGGVNRTRYKLEQSWMMVQSPFDGYKINTGSIWDPSLEKVCNMDSIWTYQKEAINTSTDSSDYFNISCDYEASFLSANKNNPNAIDITNVQMPCVAAAKNALGIGNHWRLFKRTKLFKGEDFFFYFKKLAASPSRPENDEEPLKPFKISGYECIDVAINGSSPANQRRINLNPPYDPNLDAESNIPPIYENYPINFAVVPLDNDNKANTTIYNFYGQAYYIIEFGIGTLDDHYFIIICERSNPIFVQKHSSGVSWKLGECDSVSGANLIHSNGFRMIVRNHLGKLVITFSSGDKIYDPWVITKRAPNKEDKLINVARGHMSLWGGNQMVGFLFGPLQYKTNSNGGVKFSYPPSVNSKENLGDSADRTIEFHMGQAVPTPRFFSLPDKMDHHLKLTLSELSSMEQNRYMTSPYGKKDKSLFTQDAQWIWESGYGLSAEYNNENRIKPGRFFSNPPIKELGMISPAFSSYQKDSYIGVSKSKGEKIDNRRRTSNFKIDVQLLAGDHFFDRYGTTFEGREPVIKGIVPPSTITPIGDESGWLLSNCKTPILTQISLVADNPQETRWTDGTTISTGVFGKWPNYEIDGESQPKFPKGSYTIDASNHVLEFSEDWSEHDFHFLEHSGTIKFLLNPGMIYGRFWTPQIESLHDKTFYIEIWANYLDLVKNPKDDRVNYTNPQELNGYIKLFTGLCQGGTIETSYGRRTMTCKIEDYTKVLRQQYFYNSPFFDGMLSCAATYEILSMAGFRENGNYDPNALLRRLTYDNNFRNQTGHINAADGREFYYNSYALPSGYNRLEQPSFKFADCSTYMDAINQMNEKSGKIFYFDQYGVAHHEDYKELVKKASVGEFEFKPVYRFTTNNDNYPGQIIYNKTEIARDVESSYNHLKIVSNTPNMEVMVYDDTNEDSWENPRSEGFLGFRKTYLSQDSVYGSEAAMRKMMNYNKHFYRPPITISFETFGVPLRALDTISIDGESFRIESLHSTFSGAENKWWMSVTCEKWLPYNR